MHLLSLLSVLASASVCVLAQDATSTTTTTQPSSTCLAQNILDTCLESVQGRVDACGANEWRCLCDETTSLLTCYDNCPDDGGRNGVAQQRTSYCNAADQLEPTSTTSMTTATTTSTRTSSATDGDATATTSTSTSDGAAASETADDAAGRVQLALGFGVGAGVGLAVLGAL
ncbi:hypothetical protein AN1338.2 [Aspergillus nidulans FGSC A4]|uniref:GPI anchored serine-threonine rich protein (AFU_orthologue AFUA_1G09510) n=1 Tax=Emericella nidulans (strain FGSC A4 / ATCC 38163 / CBS 112.46 / NRRL 194 / M139) TaxID=227321 RepID=Q5BDP2_EMENI|nr:hypothetical protein [Aspergillus nidulans FGSC A4]EAA65521.1 hypothetical protein AN1338.2 [Aspergillus nidulans FGSC A4]CBF87688.1 TPA: GPI anchored serine-threonine rich protein (AFU_orthologue; AFUA_1G09510) [Aspergillus nidulans FGSC A4]|eukprot:XP_658942.1 hypothetical protein AN1338.2 [Aspergillus nidulans FGSC A4]